MPNQTNQVKNWADRILTTAATKGKHHRVLLYGEPGVGKTRLALQFPNPFFIDTDKGLNTAALVGKDVPFISIDRQQDQVYKLIGQILEDIRAGKIDRPIETVVFDSVMSMADMLMFDVMTRPPQQIKRKGGPLEPMNPDFAKSEYDHYNMIQSRMRTIFKYAADMDMNIITTAGVKMEKDDISGSFVGSPNILGGTRHTLGHEFDEVYFMDLKGGGEKATYVLYTRKYKYYAAKSKIPCIPAVVEDPSYDKLYKTDWCKEKK